MRPFVKSFDHSGIVWQWCNSLYRTLSYVSQFLFVSEVKSHRRLTRLCYYWPAYI